MSGTAGEKKTYEESNTNKSNSPGTYYVTELYEHWSLLNITSREGLFYKQRDTKP